MKGKKSDVEKKLPWLKLENTLSKLTTSIPAKSIDLLPQSRCTRKINDKIQQRLIKSILSQSLLLEINVKMH